MEAELKRLGRRGVDGYRDTKPKRIDEQTLVYPYDRDTAWLAMHYLRTPSRVLWDLFETDANRLEPLFDRIREWVVEDRRGWLKDGSWISVRARDIADFPASITQIQGTVKNAIIEGAADRAMTVKLEPDRPDVFLSIRGTGQKIVLSVDLAGRSLHERGYRLDRVPASLRENLAAQILMLARWDYRREALLDPTCGSGTFAIEAEGMARAAPIWMPPRRPAATALDEFADCEAPSPLFADARPVIIANDKNTKAIRSARSNIERAGIADRVTSLHGDFRVLTNERLDEHLGGMDGGLIVCNPPYGERLDANIDALYADLASWCLSLTGNWRAAFIVPDRSMENHLGMRAKLDKPMANGPISARVLLFDLQSPRD